MSLWMPSALVVPGHPDKVGYEALGFGNKGPKRGTVVHSAEGWGAYLKFLVQSPLAIKSWHFSVLQDGTIWQHYPINVHCWHASDTDDDDDVRANIELDGIEEEGLAGTPLTAEQTASTVEIIQFQAEHFERNAAYERFPVQPSDGWMLVEHNEVSNSFTACPSGRIPWDDVLSGLEVLEEDGMKERYMEHTDGTLWVVVTLRSGFPYSRRPIEHEVGQDHLEGFYGSPEPVGQPGNYTEGEFETIPVVGASAHTHEASVRLS